MIDDGGKIPLAWKTIFKAYIFGYTRFAPSFCNATIDLLYKKIVQCKEIPAFVVRYVYDETIPDDNAMPKNKLCKFLANTAASICSLENLKTDSYFFPTDFLTDVILELRAQYVVSRIGINTHNPYPTNTTVLCSYHDHNYVLDLPASI